MNVTNHPSWDDPAASDPSAGVVGPGGLPTSASSVPFRDGCPPLAEISQQMERSSPVFIVGEARSGSTILFRTLLKHPEFRPRAENLQESSFMIQAPAASRFSATAPRNMRRFMLEDEQEWACFLQSIAPLRRRLRLAEAVGRTPRLQWALGPSHLVARSYAFHAHRARRSARLLEKTPNHIHHVDRLMASFPHARLLYIHRHPIDVYTSLVRRAQVDPKADWARVGPEELCRRYRTHLQLALEGARRHPDSMRTVRYETFTASPESTLEEICRFLGVAHTPETLEELEDPDGWAHWEQSRHLYEGIKVHTKRWQDFCNDEDARRIQDELRPQMELLGYERYGSPRASV